MKCFAAAVLLSLAWSCGGEEAVGVDGTGDHLDDRESRDSSDEGSPPGDLAGDGDGEAASDDTGPEDTGSGDGIADLEGDLVEVDAGPDTVVDPWNDGPPLPSGRGLAIWVRAVERIEASGLGSGAGDEAGDLELRLRVWPETVEPDAAAWVAVGPEPAWSRLSPVGPSGVERAELEAATIALGVGQRWAPVHPRLVGLWPDSESVSIALSVRVGGAEGAGGVELSSLPRTVTGGHPSRWRMELDGLRVELEALASVDAATTAGPEVGLTLGDDLSGREDVAALAVAGAPITLKVYHGTRRLLLVPGCATDALCADGAANHPCVSTCACRCDEAACDCNWSELEATMRMRALSTARRWVGSEGELESVRLHYVFKRSLGGTRSCEDNGEVDVDPETYGRLFEQAVKAATRINAELGFPLIASLSPMNEANHPLQDGPQENGAGQGTVAGFLDFRDAIVQATGCRADRYVASRPDVLGMLAEAMVRGEAARGGAGSLSPEVALSLYLDVEQSDPFQVDDTVEPAAPAPVVTPLERFLPRLADRLAGRAFGDREIWVDTYPGSWAPPWYATGGARHVDPATGDLVRADPAFAAERAIERAVDAADAFEVVFGGRVEVVLGEVGWSTFDRDDEAQAAFLARLLLASRAMAWRDDRFRGFVWFKDVDRGPRLWPDWTEAELPGGGLVLACNDSVLASWLCMVGVFERMEAAWGLFSVDAAGARTPRAAWDALLGGLGAQPARRPAETGPGGGSASD